jgi:hypothetical protein
LIRIILTTFYYHSVLKNISGGSNDVELLFIPNPFEFSEVLAVVTFVLLTVQGTLIESVLKNISGGSNDVELEGISKLFESSEALEAVANELLLQSVFSCAFV